MADVAKAYRFLKQALALDVDNATLYHVEKAFKVAFAKERGLAVNANNADGFEFFATLTPRNAGSDKKPTKKHPRSKSQSRGASKRRPRR